MFFVVFLLTAGMVPFFIFDPGHFATALKMTRTVLFVVPAFWWGAEKEQLLGIQETPS